MPPSIANGKRYTTVLDLDLAPLPSWIAEQLDRPAKPHGEASDGDVEWDQPHVVKAWESRLANLSKTAEGARNNTAYQLAAELWDFAISEDTAFDLLESWNEEKCAPPLDQWELERCVNSVYSGSVQNRTPGSKVDLIPSPGLAAELLKKHLINEAGEAWIVERAERANRFPIIWPDDYEALPELEFWDDDKTLPWTPGGAVVILYGDWGSHKTNLALTMMLDAILTKGAKVCYSAGEGAHGVGKQRIPAHCQVRAIKTEDLRGKLAMVPAVPLLASADDVSEFIEGQREFEPDIIVLDTLATATAGEDENSSKMSAFLTANGPVGRIRDAFKALVVVIAHQGKDPSKGVRGHSGILGNADVGLKVTADKDLGAIEVFVEKMRDGYDRFSVYYRVEPGPGGVPVPRKITESNYRDLIGTAPKLRQPARVFVAHRILSERKAYGFEKGIREADMATYSAPAPVSPSPKDLNEHQNLVEKEWQAWKDARRKPAYEGFWAKQIPIGGNKSEVRWFLPEPSAKE